MKVMIIISYIICGLGLLGGVLMIDNDVPGAIFAFIVYGFFLALTAGIKK